SKQLIAENNLRIAATPDLTPQSNMDEVIAGKEDLAYELNVEVMPDFEPVDAASLELERPVYQPTDAEIDQELAELAKQSRTYEPTTGKDAKARDGDQVTIDFVGRIDGEAFEGGSAKDAELVLGSGQFIPGFEEQLVGAAPGDERTVAVTFPETYAVDRLKGKAAEFAVEVKEVKAPVEVAPDDALAERLGMGDLAALRNALKVNLEGQYAGAARMKVKRALLDKLDVGHEFPLPPRMVDGEFEGIWRQVEDERGRGELSEEDKAKSEDELRAEYRKIAERRVRLGLVLAEIGRRGEVTVTDEEMTEAMRQEAIRYGTQAQAIFDMMRQNPNFQAQVRAPLFEDKVVDLILGKAKVSDRPVTKEELMAEDPLPEGYGGEGEAKAEGKGAKKPAKASASKAKGAKPADEGETEKPAAKAKRAAKAKPE
ncbi:MAG: trigger factor, partial [Caulobacteraceae bacterium]